MLLIEELPEENPTGFKKKKEKKKYEHLPDSEIHMSSVSINGPGGVWRSQHHYGEISNWIEAEGSEARPNFVFKGRKCELGERGWRTAEIEHWVAPDLDQFPVPHGTLSLSRSEPQAQLVALSYKYIEKRNEREGPVRPENILL